jgi:hypothetical protein
MGMERFGWSWNLILMSYKEGFVAHRKIVQQHFMPNIVVSDYRHIMVKEAHVLIGSLLRKPDRFAKHLRQYVLHPYSKSSLP